MSPHMTERVRASLALCVMALILFSSIGTPILGISEAWRGPIRRAGAGGSGTIDAQRDERFVSGFNVELPPFMFHLLRADYGAKKGGGHEYYDEWMRRELNMTYSHLYGEWVREEFGMTEPPEPKPLSPGPGDWVVSGTEVRENEVIILTGNLIVEPGGNLTLINCTLYMNCTYDGEWQIRVKSGGIMNVLEGSNITAYNPDYEFLFYVYGRLIMRDSELHECGYHWLKYHGLWLETDEGVVLENCTVTKCCYAVYCTEYASNIAIVNCKINQNQHYGIFCRWYSSGITISHCEVSRNGRSGIFCIDVLGITISDCIISQNGRDGIECYSSSHVMITGCEISQNGRNGIFFSFSSGTISDCMISQNSWYGVECESSQGTTIRDCTFIHDGVFLRDQFSRYTIEGNTVNGKPLYYIANVRGPYNVPSNAGQVIIANSTYVRLTNANLSCADVGLEIASSSNVIITNCKISQNDQYGLFCIGSSNITIIGYEISQNKLGIYCKGSSGVTIHYCNIYGNEEHGLYNGGYYVVNATYNWWGSPEGPEYKAEGDPKDPEEVYSAYEPWHLVYEPWLTEPAMIDNIPPSIGELIMSPEEPVEDEEVTIKVNVTDALSGVREVILSYSTDGRATWTNITMTLGPDGYYTAVIPGQPAGTTVLYRIYACDLVGNWAISPEYSYTVRAKPPSVEKPIPAPSVIIASTVAGLAVIIALVVLWRRRGR